VDDDKGIVKSVSRVEEDGRIVCRVVVDFFDGACPDITFGTVWQQTPVRIVPVSADAT
jgi:hypothetical protein